MRELRFDIWGRLSYTVPCVSFIFLQKPAFALTKIFLFSDKLRGVTIQPHFYTQTFPPSDFKSLFGFCFCAALCHFGYNRPVKTDILCENSPFGRPQTATSRFIAHQALLLYHILLRFSRPFFSGSVEIYPLFSMAFCLYCTFFRCNWCLFRLCTPRFGFQYASIARIFHLLGFSCWNLQYIHNYIV